MFSMMFGLEEMLMCIVGEMLVMLPFLKAYGAGMGFLNQLIDTEGMKFSDSTMC